MIIEAGYDLHQILMPTVHESRARGEHGPHDSPLWLLTLDRDLRVQYLVQVTPDMRGRPADEREAIVAALDCSDLFEVRWLVFAWWSPTVAPVDSGWQRHLDDEALRAAPELADYELLGTVVYDDEGFACTFPRFSFCDYDEGLPVAAVIHGRHPRGCDCLACEQARVRRAEREERREAARGGSA